MKNIFVILGKSNSGKSTLASQVCKTLNISEIVLTTSRPIRPDEFDGINYFFTTAEEFETAISHNELVQYGEFRGWYYGVEKHSLDICSSDSMVIVLSPKAYLEFSEKVSKELYNIIPVFIQCSDKVRLQRALNRDCDIDEVIRRYVADKNDFKGIAERVLSENGFIIDNSFDTLEYALNNLEFTIKKCSGRLDGNS